MAVQLTVKVTGAEIVRKGLADLAAEVPKIARKDIYDMMVKVRGIMRTPGHPPTYPIRWDSDRQRRYVMAMLRAADNLPYRRSNALPSGWNIESKDKGYRLYNDAKAAVYVYGNYEGARQSAIHQSRWPVAQEVVEGFITELPPTMEQHITYYGRQVLG